jgi:nucleoid DNA-binding protein
LGGMKRKELARELAREAGLPAAAAQDRIDELVHRIVKQLRRGERVDLPGVGKLVMNGRPSRPGRR